jgi:hypothetical protein
MSYPGIVLALLASSVLFAQGTDRETKPSQQSSDVVGNEKTVGVVTDENRFRSVQDLSIGNAKTVGGGPADWDAARVNGVQDEDKDESGAVVVGNSKTVGGN